MYERLSGEHGGVRFGKVDVDDNSAAAATAGVRSVPTFVFSVGEEKVAEFCGADERTLVENIEKLKAAPAAVE